MLTHFRLKSKSNYLNHYLLFILSLLIFGWVNKKTLFFLKQESAIETVRANINGSKTSHGCITMKGIDCSYYDISFTL